MIREPHRVALIIGEGGAYTNALATVVAMLVTEGAELGGLVPCVRMQNDVEVSHLTLPIEWLDRAAKAYDVGAFERLTPKQIIDRIMLPPLPASVT